MSTSPETLLFIYGTLKRGGANHRQLAGQKFLGEARTIPGFRLYDLGEYPGMMPHPEDRDGVAGEIWLVDAARLVRLDAFECLGEGLYRRERIALRAPFHEQQVETYYYAHSVEGRPTIRSNNWPIRAHR